MKASSSSRWATGLRRQLNGTGDKLYWINKDIWSMDDAERSRARSSNITVVRFITALTVDPVRGVSVSTIPMPSTTSSRALSTATRPKVN